MRISIFSAFLPFRGGIAQFNERLVDELEKENDVSSFTFTTQYPKVLFPGKSQLVADTGKKYRANRIVNGFNPSTYPSAIKKIKATEPEVFICNYWMTFFSPMMSYFGSKLKKSNCKRIGLVHNLKPHEPRFFDANFNARFIRNYDGFVALSSAVKKDILEVNPSAKVLLHEHPLYDHFGEVKDQRLAQTELGIPEGKKVLLFFGLIRDYKGVRQLIDAFARLDESYYLVIAGEVYGDEKEFQNQIAANTNYKRIKFVNQFISDNEVSHYFSAADLCVLPYVTATQSGVTAVAHYMETPVLATNVGGLKETIDHGKTGWIIEKSEPSLIADGIVEFFQTIDPNLIKSTILKVKEERSWAHFAKELEGFIATL